MIRSNLECHYKERMYDGDAGTTEEWNGTSQNAAVDTGAGHCQEGWMRFFLGGSTRMQVAEK